MTQEVTPMCFTIDEVTKLIGLGRTRVYQEINSGRLSAVKSGKRTLIARSAIEEWLHKLPDYTTEN